MSDEACFTPVHPQRDTGQPVEPALVAGAPAPAPTPPLAPAAPHTPSPTTGVPAEDHSSGSSSDSDPVAHEILPPEYNWSGYGFNTRQVHSGETADTAAGARITPIAMTAGFRFESFDDAHARFAGTAEAPIYSRSRNPSHTVAERRIACLEVGSEAVVVGSGQAAITCALFTLLQSGDHFVSAASIYSGTRVLFGRSFARFGVSVGYVWDANSEAAWEEAIQPNTKALFAETIPNPKCDLIDIEVLARVAKRHGLPLVVDNTVATPYLIRPAQLGAAVVVHSGSKFFSGHGAAVSGAIVDAGTFDWHSSPHRYPLITGDPHASTPSLWDRFGKGPQGNTAYARAAREQVVNDIGPALSPFNSFLLHQGIETLSLRMDRHLANSLELATWLEQHPAVASVDYAGLPSSPSYALGQRVYGGRTGSVFAVTVTGGTQGARTVLDRLRLFSRMTNIGDVRSMALHPATTTHISFPEELRQHLGIHPGLLRLSVGTEDIADLVADFEQALAPLLPSTV